MDECYCALCGVCFGILTDLYQHRVSDYDVAWTDFFRLLRQRPQSERAGNTAASSYFLSGIGWAISLNTARAPPLGYDARTLDRQQLLEQVNDGHDRVAPYTSRNTEREVAFPFHAACWDLVVQEHALLAKGDATKPDLDVLGRLLSSQRLEDEGRGLHPDWAEDYDGPEAFWSDGWADHPEPEASNVAGILDSYSQLDYLVKDPVKLYEQAQKICNEPPVLPSIQGQVSVGITGPGNCYFSRFPVEILTHIISFLPTQSVHAFRIASRAIARINLDSTFWHSRFIFPNELSHLIIPSIQSVTNLKQSSIDWKLLYKRVSSIIADNEYSKNRQRIKSLNQQLLLRIRSHTGFAKAVESKPDSSTPAFICRQKLKIPGIQTSSEQSILFHQLSPPDTIYRISAHFSKLKGRPVLRGIAFHGESGMAELGRYKEQLATSVSFERGILLRHLTAGMTPEGIVGLKFLESEINNLGIDRDFVMGSFDGEVPLGQLATETNEAMKGLKVEIAQDGRIVGLGLLEYDSSLTTSSTLKLEPSPNPLWYPTIPPVTWTSTMAPSYNTDFTYLHHTIFASDPPSLKHLTHVCVFVDLNPPGIYGLQFHFDDRGPIPAVSPSTGKGVSFMINGIRGESISAAQTFYSERSQSAGLAIFTNQGRRANFSTADITNEKLLQKHVVDEYSYATGVVATVVLKGDRALPYQNLGFLCAPGTRRESQKSSELSLNRIYDDNHNVWIENEKPQPDSLLGEFVGSQPSHGFINWIALDQPISRITACLLTGKRNFRGEEAPPALVGVKFDTTIGFPKLLGRCTSFGPSIDFEDADRIVEISVGLQISERSRSIQEIMFVFKSGIRKGFRADRLIEDHECQHHQFLRSGTSCDLVGLVWSFDLGPAYIGDQGIQALYRLDKSQPKEDFVPTIYPSINWSKPPPPNLQLRPAPCSKVHSHQLESSLCIDDDHEAFADNSLTSIKVYFNAFLQGIMFYYANGTSRILGNTVGAEESLELHNERILAVYITSYVQRLPNMSLPRDTMAIGAIRFRLVENSSSEPRIRYTRRAGSSGIFGPFTNQQRGLWNAEGGGSANWRSCFPPEESCIHVESNTSFAGLWAEVTSTHIHRLGVLVSFSNPLTIDPMSQPEPAIESQASSQEEEIPGSWLANPPSANIEHTSLLGHNIKPHDYRMWCRLSTQPSKIVIYRHAAPHGMVVVGIEFFPPTIADRPEPVTTLLGFRSLWTEHAITLHLKEDQNIIGIGVKPNRPSQWRSSEKGLGLESVRIWTTGGLLAANGHDEESDGWLDATCGDEEQLEGFVVAFGEFMQAIGLVTSR